MNNQWYISRNGNQYGPYSWQKLKELVNQGNLITSDFVYGGSLNDWTLASDVPNLLETSNAFSKTNYKKKRFQNSSNKKLISFRPRITFLPYGGKFTLIIVLAIILISIIAGVLRGI